MILCRVLNMDNKAQRLVRYSRGEMFMNIAKIVSRRSTCNRKQVGCIIVKDNRILSMGYAGSLPNTPHCIDKGCIIDPNTGGCVRTIHAEKNAITWAARMGISILLSDLYCTLSPCTRCAEMIIMSGISTVIYNQRYRDESGLIMLEANNVTCYSYDEAR